MNALANPHFSESYRARTATSKPMNFATRLCRCCKRTRSKAQFEGEADTCNRCKARGGK